MRTRVNLAGRCFGNLTVLDSSSSIRGIVFWECRCVCGCQTSVRSNYLLSGHTKSCGCARRNTPQTKPQTIYRIEKYAYRNAKRRCTDPANAGYAGYGARGIKFLFSSFGEFMAHIGPKPSPSHSLDRINNNGHYEPGNVRWATATQQLLNTRKRKSSSHFRGIQRNGSGWCARISVGNHRSYLGQFKTEREASAAYQKVFQAIEAL